MCDAYKEVYFDVYCNTCKYRDMNETKDPCYDCLNEPVNINSHKPVKWKGANINENR